VRQGGRTVLTIGRNFFSPRETTIKRFQLADTITLVRGQHQWKAGADVNLDDILNYFPGNFSGAYTFSSLASFDGGRPSNAAAGERYVQAFAGAGTTGPTTEPNIKEFAAFVQDEWKVRRDLTLTFGLRYDLQSFAQPTVQNPDPQLAAAGIDTSFLKTDKNNFAPRVGFAWNPQDKLVDLVQALKAPYRQGAAWVMNASTLAVIRKFKTSDGAFMWQPALAADQPATLLGYPVIEAADMPDIAANSLSIAFGNFRHGYVITERNETSVLRDPYSNKPYVNFYSVKRIGGAVVNSEAIKLMKFSVS